MAGQGPETTNTAAKTRFSVRPEVTLVVQTQKRGTFGAVLSVPISAKRWYEHFTGESSRLASINIV